MSRGANLSIMGLYNYDNTVLNLMEFPEDFTDLQKNTVKENILVECAELEFLYPNPDVAKNIIAIWSRKELPYWDRIYKASLLEYNPIENYRRNETETIEDGRTEEHSGTDTNTASGSDALARTGSDTNTESGTESLRKTGTDTSAASGSNSTSGNSTSTDTHSGTDTVLNKTTGFDSDILVNHDGSDTTYGHIIGNAASGSNTENFGRTDTVTHNTTDETTFGKIDTLQHNTTDTTTYGKTDTFRHGEKIEHDGSSERSLLAYGNIGTMTSQDMLTQEIEVAKIVNVIPVIIESFKNRFCLLVY